LKKIKENEIKENPSKNNNNNSNSNSSNSSNSGNSNSSSNNNHLYGRLRRYVKLGWHYSVLPLERMFFYTIPDMTLEENKKRFLLAGASSILWLGAISELMIVLIEALGQWIGVRATLMGITITAAGASIPSLLASTVVAKQGFADMAIANALGANTFSILIGIGLPYFSYPLFIGKKYNGVEDGGILVLILLLIFVVCLFYVLLAANKFTMARWMGWLCLAIYLGLIGLCVLLEFAVYQPQKV